MPKNPGTRGTPAAQLDREIRESLASPPGQPHTQCYACEAEAIGVHDPQPEGSIIEVACWRHTAPTTSPAHATHKSALTAYRSLVQKAIARCSKHPRPNHSLFECVFEEVNGGGPYPTPQMRRILENAVHAARPAGSAHARKKKLDPHEAKQRLKSAGLDFTRDFHTLPSSQKDLLLASARTTGYRKRKDASGSTARMYFQYLSRLK